MSRRVCVVIVSMFALSLAAKLAQAQGPGGMNPQMRQQIMQKFDTNGNGQIDPDEQQAMQQFMQQMRGGGMGMGGGPGGPGGGGGSGGPGGGGPGGGGPGGGGPGGGGMMMNPQMRQQIMQQFDMNGNGTLEPDEQQAAQQFMQQMRGGGMGGPPGGPGGGRPGGQGGQGGPGGKMNPQMQQKILQMFDKNGNGQLDPDEKQAAMQYGQQMRGGGMGGPPGAGGPGGGPGKMQPNAGGMTKGKQTTNAAQDKQLQLLRFDKNGNGKLEPEELKAARDAAKE